MTTSLHDLIKAGYSVTRWHTMPNSRPQNLASHLWGVAMIISRTFDGDDVEMIRLLKTALEHDLAESEIGDMPRPARTPEHHDFEKEAAMRMGIWHEAFLDSNLLPWLEWADMIEAGLHAMRESSVGNSNFNDVLIRIGLHLQANQQNIPPPLFSFARKAGLVI